MSITKEEMNIKFGNLIKALETVNPNGGDIFALKKCVEEGEFNISLYNAARESCVYALEFRRRNAVELLDLLYSI